MDEDSAGGPHFVDLHVGARVRMRRKALGISQQAFAAALGMSSPQVQKYESGANRLSASKLWLAAEALQVPVTYFFEGLPAAPPSGAWGDG